MTAAKNRAAEPGAADGTVRADGVQLIRCSQDRTILAKPDAHGRLELVKLYERGSLAEARTEVELGRQLAIPGVVRYRSAGRDEETGRPCVVMDYHRGIDVEHRILSHGSIASYLAVMIARQLARTLAELHDTQLPSAPLGVVHGDVKPGNVYLAGDPADLKAARVLLIDFEHAVAAPATIERAPAGGFTGGSHGFSPPESYRGVAANPGFDVFGFGATLHTMLCGHAPFRGATAAMVAQAVRDNQWPRWPLWGVPIRLRRIIESCLDPQPERRPSMREIEAELEAIGEDMREGEPLDRGLAALHRGAFKTAAAALAESESGDSPRYRELRRALVRRRRVVKRCEPLRPLTAHDDPRALAAEIERATPRLVAWLRRFPSAPRPLALRRRTIVELRKLLETAPKHVSRLKRTADFDGAEQLLELTQRAAMAVELLRDVPTMLAGDGPVRPAMLRDPQRYLRSALQVVREAGRDHRELLEKLHNAETALDLAQAYRVLDSVASLYSGANDMVATLKDRIHRLGFYLERIASPDNNIADLKQQLDGAEIRIDLARLVTFQQRCASNASGSRSASSPDRTNNLRKLHRAILDLVTEFPHTSDLAQPALSVLEDAFAQLTDHCWELVEEAHRKLASVPIPIRPLQAIVHQIDGFRRAEVLIDRPGRSRAQLMDEHERLRLKVDQARMTRDRIARGAEDALERGHLTTALYDMERAVDQFTAETGEFERDGQRLAEQLEEAKRRKEALEQAAVRNRQLASRYMELLDRPASDHESRVAVLEERKQVLLFLVRHLQQERAEAYRRDLTDVEVAIAQERSDQAQVVFDAANAPEVRLRIAQDVRDTLAEDLSGPADTPGRIARLRSRWDRHVERAESELRQRDEDDIRKSQRRRRDRHVNVAKLVILASVLVFAGVNAVRSFARSDPLVELTNWLETKLRTPFAHRTVGDASHFDDVRACLAIEEFVRQLEQTVVTDSAQVPFEAVTAGARRLADAVQQAAGDAPDFAIDSWVAAFSKAVSAYDSSLSALAAALSDRSNARPLLEHLQRFGVEARVAGIVTALLETPTESRARAAEMLLDHDAQLAHLALPSARRAELDSLR